MMYDHCRCKRRRDRRRGEGEIVDSDSKEERRGEKQTNKKLWIWESERASERVSDSGITTKGPFFSTEKEKNLRYVDYLLYFMYLLIYLWISSLN